MEPSKEVYGGPIKLTEANEMIREFIDLNEIIEKKVKPIRGKNPNPQRMARAAVLNKGSYNAFIFTKDLIMRFFDGREKDEFGNPESSNFLMVILGAHPKKVKKFGSTFDAGSFTVLTAGCERRIVKTKGKKGKKEVRFYPLNIPKAANEYPPKKVIGHFGEKEDLAPGVDFTPSEVSARGNYFVME